MDESGFLKYGRSSLTGRTLALCIKPYSLYQPPPVVLPPTHRPSLPPSPLAPGLFGLSGYPTANKNNKCVSLALWGQVLLGKTIPSRHIPQPITPPTQKQENTYTFVICVVCLGTMRGREIIGADIRSAWPPQRQKNHKKTKTLKTYDVCCFLDSEAATKTKHITNTQCVFVVFWIYRGKRGTMGR